MPSKCHTVDSGVCVSGSSTAVLNMVSLQNFCVLVVQYSSQLPGAVSDLRGVELCGLCARPRNPDAFNWLLHEDVPRVCHSLPGFLCLS